MNAAILRNMTLEELTQYVDQCDSVPCEAVKELIACFSDQVDDAHEQREEVTDTLNCAIAEIRSMVNSPLKTADLYHSALKVWLEDWTE